MCSSPERWLLALLCGLATMAGAQTVGLDGIGRTATPAEIKAWDIDVRPDFKGLPPGQGSVRTGEEVWEAKCASCHGTFGESNEVFTPMSGYVTKADVASGHVASLKLDGLAPTRTTFMKVSQLSSLWDYVNRAMPWTAPQSLKPDEVYAVVAYMLNLNGIVPDDFTLSDRNIRAVQARMPNRNGTTTAHALWPGNEFGGTRKPDVQGSTCMRDCKVGVTVASLIPDYARDAHGNLAEQSRALGAARGVNTTRAGTAVAAPVAANDIMDMLRKNTCLACHAVDVKVVGPAFRDVSHKYQKLPDVVGYLAGKIRSGGQGLWGAIAMPPQPLSDTDARRIAQWLAQGAVP